MPYRSVLPQERYPLSLFCLVVVVLGVLEVALAIIIILLGIADNFVRRKLAAGALIECGVVGRE